METFSALLAISAGISPVSGEFPTQRPVTRSFDVFFDLPWINDWVNNRKAGDLRRHRGHYDVIVMIRYIVLGPIMSDLLLQDEQQGCWFPGSFCRQCPLLLTWFNFNPGMDE